jgi:hypothetical protein
MLSVLDYACIGVEECINDGELLSDDGWYRVNGTIVDDWQGPYIAEQLVAELVGWA